MSKYADDIRRISKQDIPKGAIDGATERGKISGSVLPIITATEDPGSSGLASPVTLEMLTYDNAQDTLIQANNGDFTIKQVATARIVDANGTIINIDVITYA